jgi:hypothetical protein
LRFGSFVCWTRVARCTRASALAGFAGYRFFTSVKAVIADSTRRCFSYAVAIIR